jgi:hypothetical protein
MSRSDGGAVFSGDIPQASSSLNERWTYPSRTAGKGRGEVRRRGTRSVRGSPGQDSPREVLHPCCCACAWSGALGSCFKAAAVRTFSSSRGLCRLTSSRFENAPYPLGPPSLLSGGDPSLLPWRPCGCSTLIQIQLQCLQHQTYS